MIIPKSVIAGSGPMYPSIEMGSQKTSENIKKDHPKENMNTDPVQASEEEVLLNLKECMESKGFLFNYRYPLDDYAPPLDQSVQINEGRQTEEDLLEHLTELTGLLRKIIRKHEDDAQKSMISSRTRLESVEWETNKELDFYERVDSESSRTNARSALDIIDSIIGGLRNAEPELNR